MPSTTGYSLVKDMDFLLGVDGDTTPEPDAIEALVAEISSDDRIGGISAIYSIDDSALDGPMAKFLIAGQRAQFAAFNMQNLLRGRNMAVLGGQFSIFSTKALREVMHDSHQRTPWVKDSEVEDSLLSLQIKSAGYLTKISATARAHVGGMTTLRGLDAQQVKWNFGAIDLMWPGQRGDTRGQPLHPNLRLRWFEHVSMVINIITRLMFLLLLVGSLSDQRLRLPGLVGDPAADRDPAQRRVALSMAFANRRDYLFAMTLVPAELYMWTRMGHFVRAWLKFFSHQQTDNWAAQAKAERGKGWSWIYPYLTLIVLAGLGARDLGPAAGLAAFERALGRLADPRCRHGPADCLDVLQGDAALPRVQVVTRRSFRALATSTAVLLALSGCTIGGSDATQTPSGTPASADTSTTLTIDSRFTEDGSFSSRTKIPGIRGMDFVYTVYPATKTPRTSDWFPSGKKYFTFTFQAIDRSRKTRDPFDTKREVYLKTMRVTSATTTTDGSPTQHPYDLDVVAANSTFDPEPVTTKYGMIVTSPKGAFELRDQVIGEVSADTIGVELTFVAVVNVERRAGSNRFVRETVKQVVPIAIFPPADAASATPAAG